jgi:hypothetical protein
MIRTRSTRLARLALPVVAATAALLIAGCPASSGGGGGGAAPPAPPAGGGTARATRPPIPSYWFETDVEKNWPGKRWDDESINLFVHLDPAPTGLDSGTRYVVFYNRTCDHCEQMFIEDLATNPPLAAQVTAVEVPDSKDLLTSPDGWEMPETDCELLALPLGCNWIMTTPLTVHLQDGVIQCAQEGDHKGCMGLE